MSAFIFDVESIGLHGEGYAVGGVIVGPKGGREEFCFSCPPSEADGKDSDREWVAENCAPVSITHKDPLGVRQAFWEKWLYAKVKYPDLKMCVECGWPVEANFLSACVRDGFGDRDFEGPYPLYEIASYLAASGIDPLENQARLPDELPIHHPLHDARQSARLLQQAVDRITGIEVA